MADFSAGPDPERMGKVSFDRIEKALRDQEEEEDLLWQTRA